jgi:hypothetical protein
LTTAATMLDFFNEHLKSKASPAVPVPVPQNGVRTAGFSPADADKLP